MWCGRKRRWQSTGARAPRRKRRRNGIPTRGTSPRCGRRHEGGTLYLHQSPAKARTVSHLNRMSESTESHRTPRRRRALTKSSVACEVSLGAALFTRRKKRSEVDDPSQIIMLQERLLYRWRILARTIHPRVLALGFGVLFERRLGVLLPVPRTLLALGVVGNLLQAVWRGG